MNDFYPCISQIYVSLFAFLFFFLFFHRDVYHCPFCNLCRVGKGLGVDFFHCMTCNCCLGMKAVDHKCREKGLETNCPICCDFLFTSSTPVRDLPCGHYMHSACFQVGSLSCSFSRDLWFYKLFTLIPVFSLVHMFQAYACTHYICPICSKSMGDMSVRMTLSPLNSISPQVSDDFLLFLLLPFKIMNNFHKVHQFLFAHLKFRNFAT